MILRIIGRLIMVPLGFMLAVMTALLVVFTLGLELTTHSIGGGRLESGGIEKIFDIAYGFIGLAAAATVVPAFLVVIVGEVAGIRKLLFYLLGGGFSAGVLPFLAQAATTTTTGSGTDIAQLWTVFATAGFSGGLVYWLVAGRLAWQTNATRPDR